MAIEYTIDARRGVIFETWLGDITADDVADYWRRMLADPEAIAIRKTLVDLRNCNIKVTGDELSITVKSVLIPLLGGNPWKSALLIDKPVIFGMSRQYHVFAEGFSDDAVFSDSEAAIRWLTA